MRNNKHKALGVCNRRCPTGFDSASRNLSFCGTDRVSTASAHEKTLSSISPITRSVPSAINGSLQFTRLKDLIHFTCYDHVEKKNTLLIGKKISQRRHRCISSQHVSARIRGMTGLDMEHSLQPYHDVPHKLTEIKLTYCTIHTGLHRLFALYHQLTHTVEKMQNVVDSLDIEE